MSIELMKQALEFIGDVYAGEWHGPMSRREQIEQAIRQAIAEAEKQEPVAWAQFSEIGNLIDLLEEPCKGYAPLYTHPQPKREWVGLTVMEAVELELATNHPREFAAAIEAKLKEKNGF